MSNVPPGPPVPPSGPATPAGPLTPEQDKQFAGFAHAGAGAVAALVLLIQLLGGISSIGIVGFAIFGGGGVAWLMLLAPAPALALYFVFKDRGPWVNQEAKEAGNFAIIAAGAYLVIAILASIVVGAASNNISLANYDSALGTIITLGNVFGVIQLLVLAAVIFFSLQGFLAVQKGQGYRYPVLPVRVIK